MGQKIYITEFGQFINMGGLFTSGNQKIGKSTLNVLEAISSRWPANPTDVALQLGEKGSTKKLSAKYLYHFKKLRDMELIQLKKTGNTYVAWPTDIEKLRVIHELVRG